MRGEDAGLKVVVADNQPLIRTGIRGALGGVDDIEIVGEASADTQLSPLIERTSPDVVLLDLHMAGGDGVPVLEAIHAEHPDVKLIVLADRNDPIEIIDVLRRGACG